MMRSRIASLARIAGEYWPFLLPVLLFLPGLGSFAFPGSGAAFFALCSGPDEGEDLGLRCAAEARRRGLGLRASRVLGPAGHGARIQVS